MSSELIVSVRDRSPETSRMTDSDWLASLCWTDSAADELTTSAAQGDVATFSHALAHHGVFPSKALKSSLPSPRQQALWLFEDDVSSSSLSVMIHESLTVWDEERPGNKRSQRQGALRLAASLDAVASPGSTEAMHALEDVSPRDALAWLTLLAEPPKSMPEDVRFRLWRTVLEWCQLALPSSGAEGEASPNPEIPAWEWDELCYRAGVMFADIAEAAAWRRGGREGLREWFSTYIDDDGMPYASQLPQLISIVGSLTRATTESRRFETRLWAPEDQERLHLFARRSAALLLPDGAVVGAVDGAVESCEVSLEILTAFCRLSGWRKRSEPLGYLKSLTKRLSATSRSSTKPKPDDRQKSVSRYEAYASPAIQSDDSFVTLLRTDWSADADAAIVTHDNDQMVIDLVLGDRRLLSGLWEIEVERDGIPQKLADEWSCDCWHSDADGDYAEFRTQAGDVTISRQLFLSRHDRFLIASDALRWRPENSVESNGDGRSRLFCRSSLPLTHGIGFEEDGTTREMQLAMADQTIRVIPVSLPSDRVRSADGRLESGDGRLQFESTGSDRLCQVLVLDWAPSRTRKPIDWSTATVAEEGRTLTRSEATAARWRIGTKQWFYLQNLLPCEVARSVLGHHTASETVIGRFRTNGQIAPLVHITPSGSEQS